MPTVPPNITVLSTPATQVVGLGATTYEQIQASIGAHAYGVKNLYQFSSNLDQLTNIIVLKKYDANGTKFFYNLAPTIDPYQYSSALDTEFSHLDYAFDGNNGFYPTINANTTVNMQVSVYDLSPSDLINSRSNFEFNDFFTDFDFQ
jgi:hypothetical protein